jgi:2-keto-myo-inositol isomerase
MQLGLNGATTLTSDLATDIAVAGKAGFDFVEIWAAKLTGYLERGGLTALRRDLRAAGVRPATINSVEHITFNDPSGHVRVLEDFRRLCRVAGAIGCETVLVVPSPRPPGVTARAIERESARMLYELSAIASEHGVRLAYEFLGFSDCTVNSLAQCAGIVERLGVPNVGLVLDTFHFHAGGSRLASIADLDPDRLFMVHLNDVERAPRKKMHDALRLYPGRGVIPLEAILRGLKQIGYTGGISVEIFRPQYWQQSPLTVAREARASALAVLKKAGLA